ncbi:hypothetical protein BDV95DRAFT_660275 [Massariosphaeria phaeospora]|uniref:Methyltransferase domain-containing protein n=1 Tax=Massariosphaeria phaeospora TaxID=100035 RepID=A0A7C8MBR1_9PLEO|nr:hypothetical protein BDV95DRAFT_660275 [Massariosphaeria phaeospora]
MNIDSVHLPKQAKALVEGQNKVSTYESTGGIVTSQFAAHNLTLLSPIPSGSIIHDNTCGSGTVTRAILSANPSASNLQFHATDTDQVFLDALQKDISAHSWPVTVANAKSEALPFSDDYFTHSITNIGIFFTSSAGVDGAKEIYRTLQPGGTAVVNCWEFVAWFLPLKTVHDALRPGKPFPAPTINWSDGQQLQKVMQEAGFAQDKMRLEKSEAWASTKEEDFWAWAEKTWAYLGGVGVWQESDEERWGEAVDMLVKILKEQKGTKIENGEGDGRVCPI